MAGGTTIVIPADAGIQESPPPVQARGGLAGDPLDPGSEAVPVVNARPAETPALPIHSRWWPSISEIAHNPWVRTAVRCLAGSRANERPISFLLDKTEIEVCSILKSWREPDYLYFRVETKDGRAYALRHHEYEDYWQLGE